ncbi:uracil phosphoribosyltransferase [Erysipelotrichaceae bacterium]|nr:uracil phosphoribosyltransferase [Erysipelotrichaceae bacterium]
MEKSASFHITTAEWQIMRAIWSNEHASATLIFSILEPKFHWKLSTIKTLLHRLVEKNIIRATKEGKHFVYDTIFSERACELACYQQLLTKTCSTKIGAILNALLEQNTLSFDDVDCIEKTLARKRSNGMLVEKIVCNCLPGLCTCANHLTS